MKGEPLSAFYEFADVMERIERQNGQRLFYDLFPSADKTCEDFTDGRGEDARDVRRVKIKLLDKLGALQQIGRHLGMFVDRVQQEVSVKSVKMEFVDGSGMAAEFVTRRENCRNSTNQIKPSLIHFGTGHSEFSEGRGLLTLSFFAR